MNERIQAVKNIISIVDTLMKTAELNNAESIPVIALIAESLKSLGVTMQEYEDAALSLTSRNN